MTGGPRPESGGRDSSPDGGPVVVHLGSTTRAGRVVDLSDRDLDPEAVARAVRSDGSDSDRGSTLRVACPTPGRVHDHVGCLGPSTTLRVRTALAAAARSRGHVAPEDDRIESVRDRLDEVEAPTPPDLEEARERLAGTETAVEECRERVAALRGRVQAGREAGRDVSDAEAALREAQRELTERETERAAAREALDRARRQARESRDTRDRRRRLADRLANLERAARASLVEAVREEFASAVAAVPVTDTGSPPGDESEPIRDPFGVDDVTAALAVARVATLRAPVVLAVERFETPAAAAAWLDAPVVRV